MPRREGKRVQHEDRTNAVQRADDQQTAQVVVENPTDVPAYLPHWGTRPFRHQVEEAGAQLVNIFEQEKGDD